MKYSTVLASLLLVSSCTAPFQRAKMPPAPGPIPARIPEGPVAAAPAPNTPLPEPPAIESASADTSAQTAIAPATDVSQASAPPPRRRRATRTVARKNSAPAPAAAETPAEPPAPAAEAPPAPALQLGEVLPPQQRAELNRQTETLLAACDRFASTAAGRALTTAQSDLLNRVRVLMQQSREAREKSPQEARNLAERAKLFADGLAAELR